MASFWGEQFLNKYYWQPVGYPASVFPMNPSVEAGRAEVNRQIGLRPKGTKLAFSGYSQGALVVNEVWVFDILDPKGIHHDRLDDVVGIVNFGDPMRCPGVANGNKVAGLPMPSKLNGQTTGGIAGPRDLTPEQTPDFLLSCALDGDLYAAAPVGDNPWGDESQVGRVETRVYNFIESGKVTDFFKIALALGAPIAMVQGVFNGMKFAAQGVNAPHWKYDPFVPAMVDWLLGRV
ncbi:cutinase family protein [Mycobacterium avium]|uniref:cutinase family protein n=1 Tax=Mycobacterium avium TaxID=1764 RepID=UPI0007A0398D|nr:cutinase family protein [Mycobacterium avium]